ncbi:histidine phosphatase family protein [Neobacillus sp. LXY-1]|uniref:histidine phosphatase family protein n=1 Tax=Neobacillus sp. LXY-1 TaxID=3379133 RepID=UPI003EDE812A
MGKKLLSLSLICLLTVSLFGCSTNEVKQSKETKPVEIYLVRHGKTMFNTTDRVQGWADSPLNEKGKEAAEFLGKGLKGVQFAKAFSSDSGRAIETAQILLDKSEQKNVKLIQNKSLREANFGEFEGELNHTFYMKLAEANHMSFDQFMGNFDMDILLNTSAKIDKTKQAESAEQVSERIRNEVDKIAEEAEKDGGGNVLIVSHGISLMGLLYTISPESLDDLEGGLNNASVSKLIYKDGNYKVESVNDMSYLEKGKKDK